MTVGTITSELQMFPESSDVSVAEAFARVAELCDEAERYEVSFYEDPSTGHIIHRFARNLDAEAWIVATVVDADGKRVPGKDRVVFVMHVPGSPRVTDYTPIELAMRDELAAAKADYMAAVNV